MDVTGVCCEQISEQFVVFSSICPATARCATRHAKYVANVTVGVLPPERIVNELERNQLATVSGGLVALSNGFTSFFALLTERMLPSRSES